MYFASLSVPSALLGASLGNVLDESILTLLFGLLMIFASIKQSYTNITSFIQNKENQNPKDKEKFLEDNPYINSDFKFLPQTIENRLIIDNEGKQIF